MKPIFSPAFGYFLIFRSKYSLIQWSATRRSHVAPASICCGPCDHNVSWEIMIHEPKIGKKKKLKSYKNEYVITIFNDTLPIVVYRLWICEAFFIISRWSGAAISGRKFPGCLHLCWNLCKAYTRTVKKLSVLVRRGAAFQKNWDVICTAEKNSQLGTYLFEELKLQAEPFVCCVLGSGSKHWHHRPCIVHDVFSWRRMVPCMIMKSFLVPAYRTTLRLAKICSRKYKKRLLWIWLERKWRFWQPMVAEMCVALISWGRMCEELRKRALRVRCCCPALFIKGHSVVIFFQWMLMKLWKLIITVTTFGLVRCITFSSDILWNRSDHCGLAEWGVFSVKEIFSFVFALGWYLHYEKDYSCTTVFFP